MKKNNLFKNWKVGIVCFILACIVFIVVENASQSERRVVLPVELIMPEDYVASSNLPKEVEIVIKGTEQQIYMVDINRIHLSADFSSPKGEGVYTVPVIVDFKSSDSIIDFSSVSLYTEPSELKIYFVKKGK